MSSSTGSRRGLFGGFSGTRTYRKLQHSITSNSKYIEKVKNT